MVSYVVSIVCCKNSEKIQLGGVTIAYVPVPKDLTNVKTKFLFNLTKRQLICFGGGAIIGVPLFFILRPHTQTSTAALVMVFVMLPFFLLAMYEKNGQPLEVILKQMIETKFIRPKNRPYQTNNFYEALARQRDLEMEVKRIVQNRKNGGKGKTHRQREKGRG